MQRRQQKCVPNWLRNCRVLTSTNDCKCIESISRQCTDSFTVTICAVYILRMTFLARLPRVLSIALSSANGRMSVDRLNLIAAATVADWCMTTDDEKRSSCKGGRQRHRRRRRRCVRCGRWSRAACDACQKPLRHRISFSAPRHAGKSDKSGYNGVALCLPPSNFIDHTTRPASFSFSYRPSVLTVVVAHLDS